MNEVGWTQGRGGGLDTRTLSGSCDTTAEHLAYTRTCGKPAHCLGCISAFYMTKKAYSNIATCLMIALFSLNTHS